jgi:hypothetical protein
VRREVLLLLVWMGCDDGDPSPGASGGAPDARRDDSGAAIPLDSGVDRALADAVPVADAPGDAAAAGDLGALADLGTDQGVASDDCYPTCVARLRAACLPPRNGACTFQARPDGTTKYCFPNGVTILRRPFGLQEGRTISTPQGDVCYQMEITYDGPARENFQVVYRDPGGAEVARGSGSSMASVQTLMCGGASHTVDTQAPACKRLGIGDCTVGACP